VTFAGEKPDVVLSGALVEPAAGPDEEVIHEIAPDEAAAVREAVGVLARRRQQEESWRLDAATGDDELPGWLAMFVAVRGGVDGRLDALAVRVVYESLDGGAVDHSRTLGLGAFDMPCRVVFRAGGTDRLAGAVADTGALAVVGLRVARVRDRVHGHAQPLAGGGKQRVAVGGRKRRQRERLLAGRLKGVIQRAGDAEGFLGACIVGS
jgi:hypothetical protein